jgi:hypothetical protein
MKKTLLLSALAIALLTSCGSSTNPNGSTASTDWFEHNSTKYEAQTRSYTLANGILTAGLAMANYTELENGGIKYYATASIMNYSKDSMTGVYQSSLTTALFPYYKTKIGKNGFSNPNCAKTVSIVKNSNGTYTVTGQYYMYEAYDSTKRHTIKLNFTTK